MIMDTDTVEARLLAADDERGEVGQRSPNRDSEIDADPRHLTNAPSFASKVGMTPSCILPEFGQRESARRSCLIQKKELRMFRLLTRFCLMAIAAAIACPAV